MFSTSSNNTNILRVPLRQLADRDKLQSRSSFRLLIVFLSFDILLVVLHLLFSSKLGFFHLDREQSLAAVYSGFQLLTVGYISIMLAYFSFREHRSAREQLFFLGIALLFVYLAFDEMMMLHERIGFVVNRWLGIRETARTSFRWLYYFAPLIVVSFGVLFAFGRTYVRNQKGRRVLFFLGVFCFLLALVLEYTGGMVLGRGLDTYFLVSEELFEMVGGTFFLVVFAEIIFETLQTYEKKAHS